MNTNGIAKNLYRDCTSIARYTSTVPQSIAAAMSGTAEVLRPAPYIALPASRAHPAAAKPYAVMRTASSIPARSYSRYSNALPAISFHNGIPDIVSSKFSTVVQKLLTFVIKNFTQPLR